MPLCISQVLPRSTAAKYGIKAGETIHSINGRDIRDFLDLQYYSSDLRLSLEIEDSSGSRRTVEVERESSRPLGIDPISYTCRECQNKCVFCFIDQMPPRLRKSLYIKDDDFIFSFVFGNYISLTNLSEADLKRIIDQQISPLYVSVHSTDNALRKQMMGYKRKFDLLSVLRRLSAAGIAMHLQIVSVPLWNDGEELIKSLNDLCQPDLNVLSIGIVPVGLTRFRKELPILQPYNKRLAAEALEIISGFRAKFDHVYAADEFYVLSGEELPPADYYQDFPQLENGIGMLRMLLDNYKYRKRSFLKELRKKGGNFVMLCSRSAFNSVSGIAANLNKNLEQQSVRVLPVTNKFFGSKVTVAGLLIFRDIINQLDLRPGETVILPSSIFNHEGKTLDGASILDFKNIWNSDILIVDQYFEDWDWR